MAYIFIILTAFFTVQPLIMMTAQERTESCIPPANTCSKACGKEGSEQKKTENKNCDTTTRCNASSCWFACQYLPVEQSLYKKFWFTSNVKLNSNYTENPVSEYSTDCWQPPELFFIWHCSIYFLNLLITIKWKKQWCPDCFYADQWHDHGFW